MTKEEEIKKEAFEMKKEKIVMKKEKKKKKGYGNKIRPDVKKPSDISPKKQWQ